MTEPQASQADPDPRSVPCPRCRRPAGQPCVSTRGRGTGPHRERSMAAIILDVFDLDTEPMSEERLHIELTSEWWDAWSGHA